MQLDRNRTRLESAAAHVSKAFHARDYDRAISWAYIAGYLASNWHPGFYVHPEIETVLNHIGLEIGKSSACSTLGLPLQRTIGGRNWLHVLTTATPVGGHTRFTERWIRRQTGIEGDRHFVFIIDQADFQMPGWLRQAAEESGGGCIVLPKGMTLIERALALRKAATDLADGVILNIHPYDPIPSLAFAASDTPPIVLLNQADHLFWLGAGIADIIADIRFVGQQLTLSRRMKSRSTILPIPLIKKANTFSKREYKRKIGIPEDATVLLSIGSSYKFKPYRHLNLPKVAAELLRGYKDTFFIVIGPSPKEAHWKEAIKETDGRIRVMNTINDLECFYGGSDIYLESFPVGSLTATLDAVLFGTPVVRMPRPLLPILCIDRYPGMDENAPDYDAYKELIARYIADPGLRQTAAETQKKAVEDMHTGEGWYARLRRLEDLIPASHAFAFDPQSLMSGEESDASWKESDYIWSDLQEIQHPSHESFIRLLYYHRRNLSIKDLFICFKESLKDIMRVPFKN